MSSISSSSREHECDKCQRRKHKKLEKCALRELATTPFIYRDEQPNNLEHPEWGEPGQRLLRIAPAQYGDGISSPAGQDRPSAREISNVIFNQTQDLPNPKDANALFWAWGQYLDHDLDLTGEAHPVESYPIIVPTGDPYFDPESTGDKTIPLNRSIWAAASGTGVDNPREQITQITSFLDGSNIYGSSNDRSNWLRYGKYGYLKFSVGKMLPYNDGSMSNAMGSSQAFYVSGDIRANENLGLVSMHTLWMREHNHWARKLRKLDSSLDDEELYQRARVLVEAELQAITVNEFLPLLLGKKGYFTPYAGYNPTANPGISNEFSTAAYRLGHTLVSHEIKRLDKSGQPIHEGNLPLRDAYFTPWKLSNDGGIDPVIRGLATVPSQEFDHTVIGDLRNFLFGNPGEGGLDLVALNIQRGRDHGLADYNTTRQAYGMPKVNSFSEITSDPELAQKLETLYGTPDNSDLYVVLHCEDPLGESQLGALLTAIVGEQCLRLRAGDRFWYQTRLPKHLLQYVETVTLCDVIKRNTDIKHMQREAMRMAN